MKLVVSIGSTEIKQSQEGMVSLNDLYEAAKGPEALKKLMKSRMKGRKANAPL